MITNSNLIRLGLKDTKKREYRLSWNKNKYRKAILVSNNLYYDIKCNCPKIKYQSPTLRVDFSDGSVLELDVTKYNFNSIRDRISLLLDGKCGEQIQSKVEFDRHMMSLRFRRAMSRR